MMSDMNTLARFGEESLNLLTLEEKGKESFLVEHEENQFGLVAVLFFHIAFFVIAMVMFMSFKRDNDKQVPNKKTSGTVTDIFIQGCSKIQSKDRCPPRTFGTPFNFYFIITLFTGNSSCTFNLFIIFIHF